MKFPVMEKVIIALALVASILGNFGVVGHNVRDAAPDPNPTLEVSRDGTCGNGVTCAGSRWGECCSGHGYCGSSDDYCGVGCDIAFGTCGEQVAGAASTASLASSVSMCNAVSASPAADTSQSYNTGPVTVTRTRMSTVMTTVTSTALETFNFSRRIEFYSLSSFITGHVLQPVQPA